MEMEPSPAPTMADLPADLLREIFRHLRCVADRDAAADVCRTWRGALAEPTPPPSPPRPLPWLLLPSAGDDFIHVYCFYCGIDRCSLHHRLSPAHGARCFGSHEGGWLFVAFEHNRLHAMINLRSREDSKSSLIPFPDLLRSYQDEDDYQRAQNMVILAAALSSSPGGTSCIGAGIVMRWDLIAGSCRLAFWRMGDRVAVEGTMAPDSTVILRDEIQDVIYQDGAFRFVTTRGFLVTCIPMFYADGGLQGTTESVQRIRHRERLREHVHARYLVESRAKLLMIVRFAARPRSPTSLFKVFEMVQDYTGVEKIEDTWTELESLDGRLFFVGRGCSRSYESSAYPELGLGLKEGVYFLDDYVYADEGMPFRDEGHRRYPCSDNGRWCDGHVHRCFSEQRASSAHSSPTWLLP